MNYESDVNVILIKFNAIDTRPTIDAHAQDSKVT